MEKVIKLYDPTYLPTKSQDDENYSDDVFTIDEFGMSGLAYYNFNDEKWKFHTDTVVDYSESGDPTKWKWYYPPILLVDCNF